MNELTPANTLASNADSQTGVIEKLDRYKVYPQIVSKPAAGPARYHQP